MAEETRRLIKEEFIKQYAEGGMRKIRVKSICDGIPISRNTFYAYFSDAYNVMEEIQDELIGDLYALNQGFPDTDLKSYQPGMPMACFEDTLRYINENSRTFAALLGRYGDAQFIYKWKKIIKYHFKEKYKKEFLCYDHVDLAVEQIASSAIGAYTYWVFHKDEIPLEDFSKICYPRICFDFIKK